MRARFRRTGIAETVTWQSHGATAGQLPKALGLAEQ